MKNIILIIMILFPFRGNAQAHLGSSLNDIQEFYPNKTFTTGNIDDGTKYAYTEMALGTFYFFFDKLTQLSDYCVQIPTDIIALNAQVEIYNKKYVIISETSWKAYLEGGGIIKIELSYNEKVKLYIFTYTNNISN